MNVKTEIRRVRVGDLIVDPHVQGHFNPSAVRRMQREYREEALGIFIVSVRDNGQLHVIDGQHRRALVIAVRGEDHMVQAKLHYGLTTAQEAEMFVRYNDAHQPNIRDKFRNRMIYGDPNAVAMDLLVREYGYEITPNGSNGTRKISAIAALESIYGRRGGPDALARTLWTMDTAWGSMDGATEGHLIRGLGLFFARYGDQVDDRSLAARLEKAWTPNRLLSKARSYMTSSGGLAANVARELVEIYNAKRRPPNRLDHW